MTALVFVDTNVLVYARDRAQPEKQAQAQDWLATLWRSRTGRLSVQVLSEFYYAGTRRLDPKLPERTAWDEVRLYSQWRPRAIDAALLAAAHETCLAHRLNWWDSLIVAAARAEGCALLLTEDLHDGAVYGGVTVRNPFRTTLAEATARYAAREKPASLHKPRGRPRRAAV